MLTERKAVEWAVRLALRSGSFRRVRRWPLRALSRLIEARLLLTGRI